jgi:transcriptional regulator with XRE-family HTH domain
MATIGEKIAKLRELRDYRQEYMAAQLKIQQAAYSAIETGKTDVKLSQLQKIADILEIDLAKLIGFDEKTIFNVSNDMSNNNGENQTGVIFQQTQQTEKELYERLLTEKQKQIEFLQSLLQVQFKKEI